MLTPNEGSKPSQLPRPGVITPISIDELKVDLGGIVNTIIASTVEDLKDYRKHSLAAQTLASFGKELLPRVLELIGRPTFDEWRQELTAHRAAYDAAIAAGNEPPDVPQRIEPLKVRDLREYLTLLGPGIEAALPYISEEMNDPNYGSGSATEDIHSGQHFASWARAYAFASGGGQDILPTLREIRKLADTFSFCGMNRESAIEYMETLIGEIESGNVKPNPEYMYIGQS